MTIVRILYRAISRSQHFHVQNVFWNKFFYDRPVWETSQTGP